MKIETAFLERCVETLEKAFSKMTENKSSDLDYDLYRSAVIKEFEIILEQSGKLLKKCLKPYFHSSKEVDKLSFKNIFRCAGNHDLLSIEQVDRWLIYRDNRNLTSHDYGSGLAEETIPLLPQFIQDSKDLILIINKQNDIER